MKVVSESLRKIYMAGYGYKKAGVICTHLVAKAHVQTAMFDPVDRAKHTKLMHSIDRVNAAFGSKSLVMATQTGVVLDSNKQYLSPSYTTEWGDLITIKV